MKIIRLRKRNSMEVEQIVIRGPAIIVTDHPVAISKGDSHGLCSLNGGMLKENPAIGVKLLSPITIQISGMMYLYCYNGKAMWLQVSDF